MISCEKVTENNNMISGNVYYLNGNEPVEGAKVFFGIDIVCISAYTFYQFTYTDTNGFYSFDNPEMPGCINLYATKNNGSSITHISPILDFQVTQLTENVAVDDIFMYEVNNESQISGLLMDFEYEIPITNGLVKLYQLNGMYFSMIDSIFSDSVGNFLFANVQTGNYKLTSFAESDSSGMIDGFIYSFIDGFENINISLILGAPQAEKPVIYIYPEEDQQFQVNLKLNNRTVLTESIPKYKEGWDVFVEKSGRIDKIYDYLFYETILQELPHLYQGWCIKQEYIEVELPKILLKLGINEKETSDFMEYWLHRFDKYNFYKFQPLVNEQLDNFVELNISPKPDSVIRFLFFFEGCDDFEKLPEPEIPAFERTGTTVVEWGGVLLN